MEIEVAGAPPRLDPVQVGTLHWVDLADQWQSPAADCLVELQKEIRDLVEGPRTLLRLQVTGIVRPDELSEVESLRTWLTARCDNRELLHAEMRQNLQTTDQIEGALRELVQGDAILAGALADLERLADPDSGKRSGVDGTPSRSMDDLMRTITAVGLTDLPPSEVAREAIALLSKLAVEVCPS